MRLRDALVISGSVLMLAGCGLRGDLERAPPLWGDGPGAASAEPSPDDEAPEDPNAPVPIDPPTAR